MNRISDKIIDDILLRCDIVDIISSYIPLKKAGRNFKALCPFHHEKTSSFVVSPDKQIFHCFGCGAGGDAFSFIMKHERMEFPEAIRFLADKTGVKIETNEYKKNTETVSLTSLLYKINELAASYFQNNLSQGLNSDKARKYLEYRGLQTEAIAKFHLGLTLSSWDGLLEILKRKKVKDSLMLQSGLLIKNEQSRIYDRFRNRIMFPIFNAQGKIIGFGARVWTKPDEKQAKYINSPETEIYVKSKNLYGFNFSKRFIQEKDYCIVVEGYLDFIIPFEAGIKNLVASLGTAFTIDHIRLLRRYTHNVVIVFDGDAAGTQAALRSLDLLVEEGLNVKIACLDKGFDPDSYVSKFGADKFQEVVDQAKSLFDYKLELLNANFNKDVPEDKATIAREMLSTIGRIKNAVLRTTYVRKLAQALNVTEEAILAELKKEKSRQGFRKADKIDTSGIYQVNKAAEKMLMSLMFENSKFIEELKKEVHYTEFSDPVIQKIMRHLFETKEELPPSALLKRLNDSRVDSLVCNLLVKDAGIKDKRKSFEDCIRKIKKDRIQIQLDALQKQINLVENSEVNRLKEILKKYDQLKKEQRTYEKNR